MNKEWFIFKGKHHLGPFSVEEIEKFYLAGEIDGQTKIWKEGVEKFEPLFSIKNFQFLFQKTSSEQLLDDAPPELPNIPNIPKLPKLPAEANTHREAGQIQLFDNDLPPPIPLDAILKTNTVEKKSGLSKWALSIGATLFAIIMVWYAFNEREAAIQLRIKGIMPVYLEKLEMTALRNTSHFEVALALSLDSLTLWGSTNYPGEITAHIQLKSIPKRVLGTDDVLVDIKGEFNNHVGKFTHMTLTHGVRFLPGEYLFHVEALETHYLNKKFKMLSSIDFFKSLDKTYVFDGSTLIYAGIPREFDKRLTEYSVTIAGELLKPYQDKLERLHTFEGILNETSQNYLMELEKAKLGKDILHFEAKFIKETSPLLQALVLKAYELSNDPKLINEESATTVIAPFREQVAIGKQIGEMASDMITKTQKFKKIADKDKTFLRIEFDKRAKDIKLQININIKKLEERIQKISKETSQI